MRDEFMYLSINTIGVCKGGREGVKSLKRQGFEFWLGIDRQTEGSCKAVFLLWVGPVCFFFCDAAEFVSHLCEA